MESQDEQKEKRKISKIITYVLTFLITMILLLNSRDVSALNFFLKAIVYIVTFSGGILGGFLSAWLNDRFPYLFSKIAERFNLEESIWFRVIGPQLVGVFVGIGIFGGIICNILNVKM